jgi:hypothetical protein
MAKITLPQLWQVTSKLSSLLQIETPKRRICSPQSTQRKPPATETILPHGVMRAGNASGSIGMARRVFKLAASLLLGLAARSEPD